MNKLEQLNKSIDTLIALVQIDKLDAPTALLLCKIRGIQPLPSLEFFRAYLRHLGIGQRPGISEKGMNPLEVKIHLLKNDLTITGMARDLQDEYGATFESLRTMLKGLFYYGNYNARLAALVDKKYGIKITRPNQPQTVREAVRKAVKQAA